ncbi:MAG: magnesium transporter [Deltaproteobacteria bacterium]|nr:magnesium transporter [Deltaproteobacteria bacterium]
MEIRKHRILVETAQRLIHRGATANIRKILGKTHPADVASIFPSLVLHEQRKLFDLLESDATRAEVVVELKPDVYVPLLESYEPAVLLPMFKEVEADDLADILANLPEEQSREVLKRLDKKDTEEVEDLMRYGEDTAGGIMNPHFFALHGDTTVEEAVRSLRENKDTEDVEMAFYVYVVNDVQQLEGVVSLRQLVMSPPGARLRDVMIHEVISVRVDVDQEEVARLVARYNFLAVPVLDQSNKILGIVTVDDVIDVIREEATEDILKMAGAGEEVVETVSFWTNVRGRFPWLLASCLGGILAAVAMTPFRERLGDFSILALFIPVVLGMGGNVGTQSSTIVVRGLATGVVQLGRSLGTVGRELAVGLLLGVLYGSVVGLAAGGLTGGLYYALVVGAALAASMVLAALLGALAPLTLARLHIDPAAATGPVVRTFVDLLGTVTYFALALLLAGAFVA